MDDLIFCIALGIITFIIGLVSGYYGLRAYYDKHFIVVASECRDKDSIEPLLNELERET